MQILYTPQNNDRHKFEYEIANERITATLYEYPITLTEDPEGVLIIETGTRIKKGTDTFDFSGLPDGETEGIETELPFNPIVSAERREGELRIQLINFITAEADEAERYPEWEEI